MPTARIIYTPFDASGAVRADLAKVTRSGECGGASLKSDRKDTWRCFAGNRILDPCFEPAARPATFVVCVPVPWERKATILELDTPLDDEFRGGGRAALPWAIELANGERCGFLSSGTVVVKGKRLNYSCAEEGGAPFLFGNPDRSEATWRIRRSRSVKGRNWKFVKVATAYF